MNRSDVRHTILSGIIILLATLLCPNVWGQEPFSDGFEDGDLDGWSLWIGSSSLTMVQAHGGNYSTWLLHPNDDIPGIFVRDEFVADEGVFEAWFWISNGYECNGMIAFQASDSSDNYSISCVPYDLDDWSTIVLRRSINDVDSVLAIVRGPNLIYPQEWFNIRVHRYADGLINVFTTVRGIETLRFSVRDNGITEARPFALGGWGGVYVDDARYDTLCCSGLVGDVNGDRAEQPSIGDIAMLIDAKFITYSCDQIPCISEADINHSGGSEPTCDDISIGDVSILIDYLYITGPSLGLPDCW